MAVEKIAAWNPNVDRRYQPKPGVILRIYGLPRDTRKTVHKVKRGESLWTIAGLYGVSAERLRAWNGVKDQRINAGQRLVVYYRDGRPEKERYTVVYTVRKGNYLAAIAEVFRVRVGEVKRTNRIAGGRIFPGQKLVIHPRASYYLLR